ncbi:MAG: enoyl-CoA hydratase/isomerase family protein [Proteobacteria bacterium]|nr:enoyl-CoA hydratase/isomerase family protein [Pseudomonadota bacterium]MBU1584799.1 enoyl-CoA hydratase/isomerase family protein [Pseudomonadota bacterium]MBU2453406.1 enoyl-CoA hydratase/isomerase family protein [Pseudomonadota bacterium]MBU2629522.1 enoyl-CoA hydratase/isomerase family protein [Pseudomonadota bacterium]
MNINRDLVTSEFRDNGIAILTLNRPLAMNALNKELISRLEEKFFKAESDPKVTAIVLRGAGNQFVAGADIKFFIKKIQTRNYLDILSFTRKTSELFLAIENSNKITLAILDGLSLGGGSELALSCQAIVATDSGSMAFPETAIGIYPGLGGMFRLSRKIGPALTKYYVFTGAGILASEAFDLGLVQAVVSPNELDQTIDKIVGFGIQKATKPLVKSERLKELEALFSSVYLMDQIGRNEYDTLSGQLSKKILETKKILEILQKKAPLALKAANEIIDQQVGKSAREAIEIELARLVDMFSTRDALEGLSCAGKKKPTYIGK